MPEPLRENRYKGNQLAKELLLQVLEEEEPDPQIPYLLQALQFTVDSNLERLNNTLRDDPLYREYYHVIQNNLLEISYMTPKQQMQIFNDPDGRFLPDKQQIQENPEKALYELMCDLMSKMTDQEGSLLLY